MNTQNPTKPATLTTIFEYVTNADHEREFAKLWYLHPADILQESRILGVAESFTKPSKLTLMTLDEALAMAGRILGEGTEIKIKVSEQTAQIVDLEGALRRSVERPR